MIVLGIKRVSGGVICMCMCDVLVLIWCCGDGIQWLCEVGPNYVGCHVMEWDEM